METVRSELLELLAQLQSLASLDSFAPAGETNLSIGYNHGESIDVDLFTNEMAGLQGLTSIEKQLRETKKIYSF